MARASEQFRQSDVTVWGIVALVCAALAVFGSNISMLVPQSIIGGLHQPRVAGASIETLRQQVSDLREETNRLKRENEVLVSRFAMQERSGNEITRRVGALEITVPRMLPFVVVGYAMILLLAPVTGVLNRLLVGAGIIHTPLFILFDWPGQALAFGYSSLVVAIGILTGVFLSVDPQLEEAAVSLGASRLRSFFTITLPLGIPGVVAASALVFTSVTTAYAIPVMLAGRVPYMISVVVATNLLTIQQPHLAYAQTVVVSLLAVAVTAFAQFVLSRYGRR